MRQVTEMSVKPLALTLFILALTACQSTGGGKSGTAASRESVRFPGPDVTLAGELLLPGGPGTERHPAVVLLHGCGGMYTARGAINSRDLDWARRFADWGYVALLVNSFGPRGHGSVCEMKDRDRPTQPWVERTADAYAALDYLAARNDVDPKNVFVMGWSHGGSTVIGVVRADAPGLRADGPRFRAAVAYYPGCQGPLRARNYRPSVPTLIQHGEADDWVPAAPCVALAGKMQSQGYAMRTIIYPEAHHGFDSPNTTVRVLPNVWNPNAKGERGAHVGTNEEARARAIADTRAYLDRQLAR